MIPHAELEPDYYWARRAWNDGYKGYWEPVHVVAWDSLNDLNDLRVSSMKSQGYDTLESWEFLSRIIFPRELVLES